MGGFLALLGCILLVWILYRGIKGNKAAFSKDNLNQSFMTMGLLALLLIGVIGIVVVLLRH
jgi:hypothetical protein